MYSLFLDVLGKVVILFLMILAGYACGKRGLVTDAGAKQITSILFWVVTPSLTVASLQETIGKVRFSELLECGGLSVLCVLAGILVSLPFFRRSPPEKGGLLRFAAAYSNCGFMGLPLAQAVLGDTGVAYAAMFISVFNLFCWTHGVASIRGKGRIELRKALVNPGTCGLAAGLLLFAFSLRLPEILLAPLSYLADLNTPLAMLVIGVYIAQIPLRELFGTPELYGLSAARLLLIPAVCFFIVLPFHADRAVATTVLVLSSAPAAANTVMLGAQLGGDTVLGSKAVAVTTLFSALTMPLFAALAGAFY